MPSINWMFYAGKSPSLPDRVYIHQVCHAPRSAQHSMQHVNAALSATPFADSPACNLRHPTRTRDHRTCTRHDQHQFHDYWWADYRRLEYEHSFIQWLFPVFESSGVNWDAEALCKVRSIQLAPFSFFFSFFFFGLVLTLARPGFSAVQSEAKLMREDFDIATRVIRSYRYVVSCVVCRVSCVECTVACAVSFRTVWC